MSASYISNSPITRRRLSDSQDQKDRDYLVVTAADSDEPMREAASPGPSPRGRRSISSAALGSNNPSSAFNYFRSMSMSHGDGASPNFSPNSASDMPTSPITPVRTILKGKEGHVAAISKSYDTTPADDVPELVRRPSSKYRSGTAALGSDSTAAASRTSGSRPTLNRSQSLGSKSIGSGSYAQAYVKRLNANMPDRNSSPYSDTSTATYDSPGEGLSPPAMNVAPDASVEERQKALGASARTRPPFLSATSVFAGSFNSTATLNLDSPEGVIKRPIVSGSSALSGAGITPPQHQRSAFSAPPLPRERGGLRFDPLQGRLTTKKSKKKEILYAGNSGDIPVLAVLMHARGVAIPKGVQSVPPPPAQLSLDDRKKIIMDRVLNAMPKEPDNAAIREAERKAAEEEARAREEKARARELAALEAAKHRAEMQEARKRQTEAEKKEHERERESVLKPQNRDILPDHRHDEPAGQTMQDHEAKDEPNPILITRTDADPIDNPKGASVLAVRTDLPQDINGLLAERGLEDEDTDVVAPGGVQEGAARLLAHMAFRDDMRDAIRDAGAVPALVALLKEGDNDAKEASATALAELALKDDLRRIIAEAGGIPPLVDLLEAEAETGKEAAAGALGNLAFDDDNKVLIAEAGAIPPLVDLIRCGTNAGKEAGAGALGNLAFNDDNKILIRDAGAIPPLVELLKPGNSEEAQEASGVCLWNLGLDPHSRQMICACGAIPLLVDLLDSPSERVRRTAAGALGKLALDDPARVEIARLKGIHKLLYMVANGSEDERETAANALTNVCRNDNNRMILKDDDAFVVKLKRKEKGVPILVTLTINGTPAGKIAGAKTIANLACNPNLQVEAARCQGIPPLVKLVQESSYVGKESAAGALGNLACNEENKGLVAQANGIPPLVRLLEEGPLSARECSAGALWNLAMNEDNRVEIPEAGGIPPILDLLGEESTDGGKEAAAVCLWNLACNADNRIKVADERGIPLLVKLLKHPAPKVRKASCGALGKLALRDENRSEIHKVAGTNRMMEMMRDPQGTEREVALSSLTNMALSNHVRLAIGNAGGVPPIVQFLDNGTPPAKSSASNAIANLVCSASVKDMVVQEQAIPKLLDLVQNGPDNVSAAAAGALANLACDDPSSDMIVELGGLPALCQMLKCDHGGSVEASARAMMNLSLYDKHKIAIPESGGDEALIAALDINRPLAARQAAAAAITNLSWAPEIRSKLCNRGAIPSLVLLLAEGDAQASDTAVKALYNLASTSQAKELIAGEPGAIDQLAESAGVGNLNAIGVLRRLAEHEACAEVIAEPGPITTLVKLYKTGDENQKKAAGECIKVLAKTPQTKEHISAAMGNEKELKKLLKGESVMKKMSQRLSTMGRPSTGTRKSSVASTGSSPGTAVSHKLNLLEQDTNTVNQVSVGTKDTINF